MKAMHIRFLTALFLASVTARVWAQTQVASNANPDPHSATPAATPAPPVITAADIQALKDALAAQQLEIEALKQQLQQKNNPAPSLQSSTPPSIQPSAPAAVPPSATPPSPSDSSAKSDASDSSSSHSQQVAELSPAVPQQQNLQNPLTPESTQGAPEIYNKQMEGPLTIRFRGIHITPGGYAAGEFVWRSRALSADMSTPFNSLTMPGASQSQQSEIFGSARQSKITGFVDGRVGKVDLSAYVSTDFLSAGTTSTSTSTNGYTLRLRQAWGQAKFEDGWSFLAGQSWSLVTEDAKGISPDDDIGKTNDVRPKTIDSVYNVGFNYARQPGVRITKTFGDAVAFAVAVENSQATLTTHGNAANYLLGQAGASSSFNSLSTYSFNPSPDIIAKVAFDPGFGHYEVYGLFNRFTGRAFPCVDSSSVGTPPVVTVAPNCPSAADAGTAVGAFSSSKNGGAIGASARWVFAHHVVFGLKGVGGSGIGRYGPAGLPDVSINPDGTVRLVKNLLGLSTLEFHTRKFDVYGYTGAEYAARTYGFDPISGKFVGYGAPTFNNSGCYIETPPNTANGSSGFDPGTLANCTADTRVVIEGTTGFWYRITNSERGRFQFGAQYSYVTRNTWTGDNREPHGIDNMIFTSFRYYLP
jgi:hypothetical protein